MKKSISSIFVVVIFVFSCNQEQDLNPANDFETEISFLSEINASGLNLAVSNLGSNIIPIGTNEIRLNKKQLAKDMLSGLNGKYFNAEEKAILDFSNNYSEVRLPDDLANARKNGTVVLSTFEIYSKEQLVLFQPFVDDLLNEENINEAKSKAVSFQHSVINSTLTEDEKLQLLSVSTGVISFAEFVEKGGIEKVQNILSEELGKESPSNGRVMGCSVNMRDVMAGAIVGGAGGAIAGGYGGATAGTVAFPIVGTVTGGVGGAVVGGAFGFVSGALSSIAASLLTSCGR